MVRLLLNRQNKSFYFLFFSFWENREICCDWLTFNSIQLVWIFVAHICWNSNAPQNIYYLHQQQNVTNRSSHDKMEWSELKKKINCSAGIAYVPPRMNTITIINIYFNSNKSERNGFCASVQMGNCNDTNLLLHDIKKNTIFLFFVYLKSEIFTR